MVLPPDECPFLSSLLASFSSLFDGGVIVSFLGMYFSLSITITFMYEKQRRVMT